MNAPLRTARLATILGVVLAAAPEASTLLGQHEEIAPIAADRLYAATTDGGALGAAVQVRGGPPWVVQTLGMTDGGRQLRRFGRQVYVVNDVAGTITRLPAAASGVPQVYDLGPTSEPQDIHVPGPQAQLVPIAYVTRRHDPFLHRLDLTTGQGTDVVDLGPVGGGAEIALGTLERDGTRLFVQVRVFDSGGSLTGGDDTGVLAVVDLTTHTLIDVDPAQPGVQGVALQGAPPRLKMQILPGTRTLFVSTTDGFLDGRGGIEMVDLDTLTSIGFALSEQQVADLGGFVMIKPDEGFFVFHTDLLPSTHLMHFTIEAGPDPGPEIIVLLEDTVDALAYNPFSGRIFLPSGFSSAPRGIYVFDAQTQQPVGSGPIDTGMRPHDVILGQ
jgi:hypothetical protein